jgi:hypothetical protein
MFIIARFDEWGTETIGRAFGYRHRAVLHQV